MVSSWKDVTLGDVITLQRGFDLPTQDRVPGNIPIVSSSGITGSHLEAKVDGPGVITGRYGTIGQVFYVRENFWPLNTTLYVKDFKGNDPRFVSYLLRTMDFGAHNDKSSVPGVNRNHLHLTKVRVPTDIHEQRAIAAILGSLDDKIELNHRMNVTLEEIARAHFKSWFIDFDPIRAKAAGGTPSGMSEDTASLFPDSFQDSPLGKVPLDWPIVPFTDLATFTKGISYSSSDLREADVALVTLKSVARGGGYQKSGLKSFAGEFKSPQRVQPGEIVVAHTDLTQTADVLGRPVRVQPSSKYQTLVASLDLVIVRPAATWVSNEYIYNLLSHDRFQDHAFGYANGTTVLHLSTRALPDYQVPRPPPSLVEAYTQKVSHLYKLHDQNELQSETLGTLRETLMPKLVSGELRVTDTGRLINMTI